MLATRVSVLAVDVEFLLLYKKLGPYEQRSYRLNAVEVLYWSGGNREKGVFLSVVPREMNRVEAIWSR